MTQITLARAISAYSFLCAALLAAPVQALELEIQGFGTLGAARTTDGRAEMMRDLSQPHGITDHWTLRTDTLLGLQANLQLRQDLEAVVQAVSRYKYDATYAPDLTWAFIGLSPSPAWTLRAGRLGTEFYMLADSRFVGYSY